MRTTPNSTHESLLPQSRPKISQLPARNCLSLRGAHGRSVKRMHAANVDNELVDFVQHLFGVFVQRNLQRPRHSNQFISAQHVFETMGGVSESELSGNGTMKGANRETSLEMRSAGLKHCSRQAPLSQDHGRPANAQPPTKDHTNARQKQSPRQKHTKNPAKLHTRNRAVSASVLRTGHTHLFRCPEPKPTLYKENRLGTSGTARRAYVRGKVRIAEQATHV